MNLFGMGKCPVCSRWTFRWRDIENRRMSSQYEDEDRNWIVSCDPCFIYVQEGYADMWREYYSGCL